MEKEFIKLEVKDVETNFEVRVILKKWKAWYDYQQEAWDVSNYFLCLKNELDTKFPTEKWNYSNNIYNYSL